MNTFSAVLKGRPAIAEVRIGSNERDLKREYTSVDELTVALPSRIDKLRSDIVGDAHSTKFCPAILVDGSWVILTTPDYALSDLLDSARDSCRSQSSQKAEPLTFTVSPTLLLTLRTLKSNADGAVAAKEEASSYKDAFREIISWGINNNASDVTLNVSDTEPLSQINFTIDGQYMAPARWKIASKRMEEILNVAWQSNEGGAGAVLSKKAETQCRVQVTLDSGPVMGRWSGMAADRVTSVTLRLLKVDAKSVQKPLDQLGYLPSQIETFERAQRCEGGAIIFSGVVGSGKTVSLASLLSLLPATRKIISLEDPVELIIPNVIQNTVTRSLEDLEGDPFTAKLMTLKRSAPNDVYLGEIRDLKTGTACSDIIASGTNLYSTTHATSAMQIPEKLYSEMIGMSSDFLSSPGMLNLLVYQALIPKLCKHCAPSAEILTTEGGIDRMGRTRTSDYWKQYFGRISKLYQIDALKMKVRSVEGCRHCNNVELPLLNGYLGRDSVSEMIEPVIDREVLRKIKARDMLGLQEHLDRLPKAAFDDPDMTNKTIVECAIYKALQGTFDPRDIEGKTKSFETIELIQKQSVR
ncbi:ATPase, T2SS/T4P/T4SS family [Pseudomonas sp. W22_MBD1_FP4]|uniref:ATPase, T2SS/T4P/T4SS family n=1 Tax=Pseudomonas sp. W22_MBD1_FP4 TaxID=3240272 RepID=UPI003F962F60